MGCCAGHVHSAGIRTGDLVFIFGFQKGQVWEVMIDYGNLNWAVGIAEVKVTGEGVGMVRSVRLGAL